MIYRSKDQCTHGKGFTNEQLAPWYLYNNTDMDYTEKIQPSTYHKVKCQKNTHIFMHYGIDAEI